MHIIINHNWTNWRNYLYKQLLQEFTGDYKATAVYKDEDIQMIVFNYKKDQFSLIDKQKTKNDDIYYHINVSNNLNINFADEYIYGYTNPELYNSSLNKLYTKSLSSAESYLLV